MVEFTYKRDISKIKKMESIIKHIRDVAVILICLFFIMSALWVTYTPSLYRPIQIFTLLFSLTLLGYELRYCSKIILSICYIAVCNLFISPIFAPNGYIQNLFSNTFILNIFLGYILFINKGISCKLLYILLIANAIAILVETFFHINIVTVAEGYDNSNIRFLYKLGLFSAPKTGAFFIIAVALLAYVTKKLWILFLGVFISVFTGVRVSTVCLSIPLVILWFKDSSYKTSTKIFLLLFFSALIVTIGVSFYNEYGTVFDRLATALDAGDGSNKLRFYFWNLHWSFFWNQSIEHILWGNYGAADNFFGNGPECAFLDLMNNGGLVSLILFSYPLVLVLRKANLSNYIFCFSVLIAMVSGRFSIGFSDGIVYWFTIFYLLENNKKNIICKINK